MDENRLIMLEKELMECKLHYYETGNSLLSDEAYDSAESLLKKYKPNSEVLQMVGYNIPNGKYPLKNRMLSMDKIHDPLDIHKWYSNNKIPFNTVVVAGPKLDGNAVKLVYDEKGYIKYGITRGNGSVGHIIGHITEKGNHTIPVKIDNIFNREIEVLCEAILPKSYNLKEDDKTRRNTCAGIIKTGEGFENLHFVTYGIENLTHVDIPTMVETARLLDKMGFQTIHWCEIDYVAKIKPYYDAYINEYRDVWNYETDGLVITTNSIELQKRIDSDKTVSKFHHYNMAIKPPSEGDTTTLLDVEISINKDGVITPTAIIDPVEIMGVMVDRATLHNYSYIQRTFGDLYRGSMVYVKRSGDVIPKITEIVLQGEINPDNLIKAPTICPLCGSELFIGDTNIICINELCDGRAMGKMNTWITNLNILDIGPATITELYKNGKARNILELYTKVALSKPTSRSEEIIIDTLNKSKIGIRDIDIMGAVGIRGVKFKTLQNNKLFNIDTIDNDCIGHYAVLSNIREWLNKYDNTGLINRELLRELKKVMGSKSIIIEETNYEFGEVVITGDFPGLDRDSMVKILTTNGFKVKDNVTKNTYALLSSGISTSNKYKRAVELGKLIFNDIDPLIKSAKGN